MKNNRQRDLDLAIYQAIIAQSTTSSSGQASDATTELEDMSHHAAELLRLMGQTPGVDNEPATRDAVTQHLSNLLESLTRLASQRGITLEEIARQSLAQVDRQLPNHQLFDQGYPEHERIPRVMHAVIRTDAAGHAHTTINGTTFGNPLTDNRHQNDGYRYHDVFHLTHAAILGWSPTLRGLLRRKRKSDPDTDEIEDGGRAIVINEGLTALIFSHAEQRGFYQHSDYVDPALVNTVQTMTSHLEVSVRSSHDWQQSILRGFHIWRQIRDQQGGQIHADLHSRTIKIITPNDG